MDSLDLVSPYLFKHKGRNFAVMNKQWPKDLDALQHFEVRPTDTFLITFPKSGTVWTQQILVKIMEAAHPDWVEDAINILRVPWLEEKNSNKEKPDPRVFTTHFPVDMLPHGVKTKRVKIVYVWRNPKDVLVSLYHFAHSWDVLEIPQSFEDFFQQFLDGNVYMGSWFDHVKEYQTARDQLDIHFVQYENMLKDLRGEVVKICAFLGKDLTDEAIDHVVEMSTFKNMKTNPKANYMSFSAIIGTKNDAMRKGIAGDWKNFFTVAQNEQFDKVFKERMNNWPLNPIWVVAVTKISPATSMKLQSGSWF